MLGIKNFDYSKNEELITSFFEIARTGKTLKGDCSGHTDGWGIGYYKNGKANVFKSGNSVLKEKDSYFKTLKKISTSKILIIHFRKSAWSNTNSPENSHPFLWNNFLFAHNGTIYNFRKLLKEIKPAYKPRACSLDTEVYFRYIISNNGNETGLNVLCFRDTVSKIKKNNKYSSLTCLIADGNNLCAYREFTKSPDYYTLFYTKIGNSTIICSELISKNLKWRLLGKSKLFTY